MSLSVEQAMLHLKGRLPEYIEQFRTMKVSGGQNYRLNCVNPAHPDKNPSCFLLAPKGELDWKFYCHSCGVGGDIFTAASLLEEKPLVGPEFLEDNVLYLAKKFELEEVRVRQLTEKEKLELSMYQCMKSAVDILRDITPRQRLHMNPHVRKYIYEHGWVIDDESGETSTDTTDLDSMGVFWINNGAMFREKMKTLGYDEKFLSTMDLWTRGTRDRHPIFNRNSLIFTVFDARGRPVGFASRDCRPDEQREKHEHKYINSMPSLQGSIYHKGRLLYNIHNAKGKSGPTYVVEGYSDVVTMRINGFDNCVAMMSSHLTEAQMMLLRANNIINIVLVIDGDDANQDDKITKILDDRISGQTDIRCKIVILPEGHDPDSYIREYGLDEFFKLRPIDAFEYRLEKIQSDVTDSQEVCEIMIPLIANEPSGVSRENMAKKLAQFTGFSLSAILADVDIAVNRADAKRQSEKEALLADAMYRIKDDWESAPMILITAANRISEIDHESKSDIMSTVEFSRAILNQQKQEEERGEEQAGFRLGPHLQLLDTQLAGEWEGSMTVLGGRANTGKTTLMTEVALYAALEQEDVLSVLLTLDDARTKIIPRLVCLLAYRELNNNYLTMNMVARPAYWSRQVGGDNLHTYRSKGYEKLAELVTENRLIVKDTTHGSSFPYIQALTQHIIHANPDKRVLFFLDNFHKVSAGADAARDREFNVELALNMKNHSKVMNFPIWAIAEYHKLQPGTRPTNNHLAETVKLEYEADVILHLYNELHDLGLEAKKYFLHDGKKMPLVECIFGKNKINDYKDSVWMKFFPEFGRHETIGKEEVEALVTMQPKELDDDE